MNSTLLKPGRGILVLDSYADQLIHKATQGRFSTHSYLGLVAATRGLSDYLSGVLMTEGLLRSLDGKQRLHPSVQLGVRLATGRTRDGGEGSRRLRSGSGRHLDNLRRQGVTFVEWRANLPLPGVPRGAVHIDAKGLAEAALLTQSEGLFPVVTVAAPDLGDHSINVSRAIMCNALTALFAEVSAVGADLEAMALRCSMVAPGDHHHSSGGPDEVGRETMRVVGECVPEQLPGVLFLSGGAHLETACSRLAAITHHARPQRPTRRVGFAFTRALITESAAVWDGNIRSLNAQQRLVQACRAAVQATSPLVVV